MLGELVGGRYRLERELGRGGFGAVYVAVQEDLGRRVALKVLHQRHLEGVGFDRFRREAQLAQHLSHPNTVRLFDFGLHDGRPFIVFELLVGESLASLLQRAGALHPARVIHISRQILKSLMEAHEQGIIHRDIKPANIFICAYAGEADFVKVLDFGIAKSVQEESAPLTGTGEAVGTPAYMPPEQLSGGVLGPATDLYAVGLVMAELASGNRVLSGSGMDIAMRQLDPGPLTFPESVTCSPLWPVIARATQKQASRRFTDASHMLSALDQLRLDAPAAAMSPAGPPSFTVPIGGAAEARSPGYPGTPMLHAGPVSSTLFDPRVVSLAAQPKKRGCVSGVAALLVAGASAAAIAAAGVAAYFFVDFDALMAEGASVAASDAGAPATPPGESSSASVDDAPFDAAPAPGAGTAGKAGTNVPTASPTQSPSAPGTVTPASTKPASGATLGQPCVSDADCKGALEKCGQGGTCQCTTQSGIGAPRVCGGRCVPNTDPNNCGACGKRCTDDEVCTTNMGGSVDHPICYQCTKGAFGSVRILCGPHVCVAPNTDPRNCGGCNKKCAPGQSCEGGVCK